MNQSIPLGADFSPQASNMMSSSGSALWPIIGIIIFGIVAVLIAYKVFLE